MMARRCRAIPVYPTSGVRASVSARHTQTPHVPTLLDVRASKRHRARENGARERQGEIDELEETRPPEPSAIPGPPGGVDHQSSHECEPQAPASHPACARPPVGVLVSPPARAENRPHFTLGMGAVGERCRLAASAARACVPPGALAGRGAAGGRAIRARRARFDGLRGARVSASGSVRNGFCRWRIR